MQTPFGITHSETASPARATNVRFPGQWADAETGLSYNYFRSYDPTMGRYIQSDPIGILFGNKTGIKHRNLNHLYSYVSGNPLRYRDPLGLEPWDWDGQGDTSVCKYYDELSAGNPSCSYFEEAARICRGQGLVAWIVEIRVNLGIEDAWEEGVRESQSEIYDTIRNSLIEYDRQVRSFGRIDSDGCTCGNAIDDYHERAFEDALLDPNYYGGNSWPQDTWPNPVPNDPRN